MRFFIKKIKQINLATLLLIGLVFWLKGAVSLDPDFGYRLKTGELILSQGFPKTDPYSYTMPSFPYVEHAWLIAVSWALLYPIVGKVGLAGIYAALALVSLIISMSRAKRGIFPKKTKWLPKPEVDKFWFLKYFPFFLAASLILPFSGVRAQVVSWLAMSTLLYITLDLVFWKKYRLFMPLFFLFWANLHGSFAAGILVLLFVVLVRSLRDKKVNLRDLKILTLSLIATFINPHGLGSWKEVWLSVSDASLRWRISEWLPSIFMANFSMAALMALSLVLILRYRKKLKIEELGLYFLFLLQALASRRHLPLFVIVALPLTVDSINFFYFEIKNIKGALARLKKFLAYAWIGSVLVLLSESALSIRSAIFLSEERFYPQEAVNFLNKDLPRGEIFSEYGWGGYLIWKLPEKKVFIDGRMPSWRWKGNPSEETGAAFDDYTGLLNGKIDYKEVFGKYQVEAVLWPVRKPSSFYDILQNKLNKFLLRFGKERFDFDFLNELERDDWEKIYQDSIAIIYKKPS